MSSDAWGALGLMLVIGALMWIAERLAWRWFRGWFE